MDLKNHSIGEILKADYRIAGVFKKYGLDLYGNSEIKLSTACQSKGLDLEQIVRELKEVQANGPAVPPAFGACPLDMLASHIQNTHHRYVDENIPVITEYLNKLLQAHGKAHPELVEISSLFRKTTGELNMHMKKEELMVFPYIKRLVRLKTEGATNWKRPVYGTVENPIKQMLNEHDAEGKRMKEIARLSNQYQVPADGCETYRVAYQKLQEFEEDLYLHIHLENNILFPKAIELEQRLVVGG